MCVHLVVVRSIRLGRVSNLVQSTGGVLWTLLASGQIQMRKADGWETLPQLLDPMAIDLAARSVACSHARSAPPGDLTAFATVSTDQYQIKRGYGYDQWSIHTFHENPDLC